VRVCRGIYQAFKKEGHMKVAELTKSTLAAFAGGVPRVRYSLTGIELLGKVEMVKLVTTTSLRTNEPYIQITLSKNLLERRFFAGRKTGEIDFKGKHTDWREMGGKIFSFGDKSGVIVAELTGPHKCITVVGTASKIALLSPSHPKS